jgi:hypothetical protein
VLLSASIPLSLTTILTKTEKFVAKKWTACALLVVLASAVIGSEMVRSGVQSADALNPNKEVQLTLAASPATALPASDIFVVNGRRTSPHISELVSLMGAHGVCFYQSSTAGTNRGLDGVIASDDVVLIKINEQWPYRGGTNTDVLRELLQAIVDHPEGFDGEIVVVDNGQGWGSMNWPQGNADDISQSTQDVVDQFSPAHEVSTYDWQPIRGLRVDEYAAGDLRDGYILYDTRDPDTGIYVSYPKFQTKFGTYISFKFGVWNGTAYEKRVKVINLPVLKSHSVYAVTACLKHYMGVQSEGRMGGLANGHAMVGTGGMGTLMVETGLPTLNIVDAIWVNANPGSGPSTPYSQATRVNVLMASTDPVALDYWAAKHVLVQTARLLGHTRIDSLDPDQEAFGVWLNRTKNEIRSGGYNTTTDEKHMNVYVSPVLATVNFDPDTLNVKSRGRWVTVYLELPDSYRASDIEVSSILLNDTLPVDSAHAAIGDHDQDDRPDLMVKFNRASVVDLVSAGDVVIAVTGNAKGVPFEGLDTVRVIGD